MTASSTATDLEIRCIPPEDYMALIDLWSFAFQIPRIDPLTGDEGVRERVRDFCQNGVAYLVGAYDRDRLAAAACFTDFEMHLGDRWVKCGGIDGVATYPEYRRKGLVKVLLKNCLQVLHDRRVPVASLWPFSYPFYERMGWAATDMQHQAQLNLSTLRTIGGDSSKFRACSKDDLAQAMGLHDQWCERLNLSLRRSEYRWKKMLEDERFRYRLFVHKEGYMMWNLERSTDGTLNVSECCYLSDNAFIDALALIAQMDSQFDRVQLAVPEIESILRIVGIGCKAEIRVLPGMMSRVVHLEEFLKDLPPGRHDAINVTDPLEITAPDDGRPPLEAGPGALIQHVTGFWKQPNPCFPVELYGIGAQFPPYSIERY